MPATIVNYNEAVINYLEDVNYGMTKPQFNHLSTMIEGIMSIGDNKSISNAVTGWELTGEELMVIAERLHNLKRMYNVRLGISRKDDKLPPRLMSHDKRTGAAAGILPHMGRLLSEYYSLRGWTQEGIPTKGKLAELGL
jgi:aldehyde:ferredoxin oxidoreductase